MRSGSLRDVSPTRDESWIRAELESIQQLSRTLDDRFRIPGTRIRFGFDAIVGLIPGVGDIITSGFSLYIVSRARAAGVSRLKLGRMLWNVLVDVTLGTLPVVGDIFDVTWKSNRKNLHILRRHLESHLDPG